MAGVTIYAYSNRRSKVITTSKEKDMPNQEETKETAPVEAKKPRAKKPTQDELIQSFANRKGYDYKFVRTRKFKIDLDDLLKNLKNQLTPLLQPQPDNDHFLKYHHFTIAMNRERKMPLLAAVNINGAQSIENPRDSDKWSYDPRIDKTEQLGKDIYKNNNLDLGHLIRRLDPVWGEEALQADEDTFHFTVCAPQHKKLNRVTWLSLENYILKNTDLEDLKVSVFTGPVFSERDMDYRDIKLPLQFWKMVALIKKDGTPSVTAYILSHEDYLSDMGERGIIGEEGFGEYKTFQISLNRLQELTHLNIDKLKIYDPLMNTRALGDVDYFEVGNMESIVL